MPNNSLVFIEKTLPRIVDKVFAKESVTDVLLNNSDIKLDFLDAKTVKIFKLATTGYTNYKRGGHGVANSRGAVDTTFETFTLSQERYAEIPLDGLDSLDDGGTVLGHLATEFLRTKSVPEVDAYRLSKLAGFTSVTFGNRKEGVINADKIITEINAGLTWMAEQKVPEGNQIIYVSPKVMEMIRNTPELYKKLSQSEYRENVSFSIEKYEGRQIVVVPSDEFFTDITIGDGYYPSKTSKVINFLIVDKGATAPIKKLQKSKTYSSEETYLGYDGYLVTNILYHDIFVPENKRVGIYAHISTTDAKTTTSALLVNAVKGVGRGNTIIENVLTQPAGIIYDTLTNVTDGTIPAIGSVQSGSVITLKADFTPNPTHNVICANFDGKVVAVSKNFGNTLPKGE